MKNAADWQPRLPFPARICPQRAVELFSSMAKSKIRSLKNSGAEDCHFTPGLISLRPGAAPRLPDRKMKAFKLQLIRCVLGVLDT